MHLDHKETSRLLHEYFIQSGILSLPGIGLFRLMRLSAQVDSVQGKILPPSYTVRYENRGEGPSKELFVYLSLKTGLDDLEAVRLLNHFSFDMKDRLQHGEEVEWPGFGILQPDKGSGFGFEPQRMTFDFTSELEDRRVLHKGSENDNHPDELGRTDAESGDVLSGIGGEAGLLSRFWFRALLVALIALLIIASRFLMEPSSLMPYRTDTLQPAEPEPVYSIQKQP